MQTHTHTYAYIRNLTPVHEEPPNSPVEPTDSYSPATNRADKVDRSSVVWTMDFLVDIASRGVITNLAEVNHITFLFIIIIIIIIIQL